MIMPTSCFASCPVNTGKLLTEPVSLCSGMPPPSCVLHAGLRHHALDPGCMHACPQATLRPTAEVPGLSMDAPISSLLLLTRPQGTGSRINSRDGTKSLSSEKKRSWIYPEVGIDLRAGVCRDETQRPDFLVGWSTALGGGLGAHIRGDIGPTKPGRRCSEKGEEVPEEG